MLIALNEPIPDSRQPIPDNRFPTTDSRQPTPDNRFPISNMNLSRSLLLLCAATLYLALSGFECASSEVTTARVALKSKDYKKAEEALKKEVAARPGNVEAWLLLGDIYNDQSRWVEMDEAYAKAEAAPNASISNSQRQDIAARRFNGWLNKFNAGLKDYNSESYSQALKELDSAEMLRKDYPENIFLRAQVYLGLKDDAMVTKTYQHYAQVAGRDVDPGLAMGLALGLDRRQLETRAGKPDVINVADSVGGFAFYKAKNLYVYFAPSAKPGEASIVEGWKFYGSDDKTPEIIRQQLGNTIRSSPWYSLGVQAYNAAESDPRKFDDALKYLRTVEQLDATRDDIGEIIAEIYVVTKRTDEAMRALDEQIRRDPKNPRPYINYGNLYNEQKQFDKAIEQFSKVLAIDLPSDDKALQTALFNLGAVYKNLGARKQDEIREASKGKPTNDQIEQYRKPLRESKKYFEQLKAIPARRGDYQLLGELANLYDVLAETDNLKSAVREMEAVENVGNNARTADYWRRLSRLYAIIGDGKKAEAADKKATELGG
ncbi:MAG: tetratricopeptide repeat protein [Chlorobi bacterium]|nr:tetratricopeptide repeat protein [Chlorobiota bacterium]